ncbi:MAG: hypothetical protein AUJ96_25550 [Armatimonadetes bacterium CG2_30_66_41]|nr:diversity-generating retroelement protein Avd [Armatimonadota bacterium]OIO96051.1 MAG: hypothetical protein AUJ96_25550 [Armatimonadetes bacterium CG2_30_66_41]
MQPQRQPGNALTKAYDLAVWIIRRVERMPRLHRYHLGLGLQEMALELVDRLIVAEYTKDRTPLLREINLHLEQMRYRVRLCKDVGLLKLPQYESCARQIDAVGMSVGAWGKKHGGREEG